MRLLLGILLAFSLVSQARAETLTLVADIWCPYNCESKSEKPGALVEIAQRAFAKHNITIEYHTLPWSRAIKETGRGHYSAIVGASRDDAPNFIFPSQPQGMMRNVFYVKKGNPWRYNGIDTLKSVSVGIIADYTYSKHIDPYLQEYAHDMKHVQSVTGDNALDSNFKKLMAGRIDALLEAKDVMQYYIMQNHYNDAVEEAGMVAASEQDNLYIAFSPANPKSAKYAAMLSQEMDNMRASGELSKLLAAYGMEDWKR